MSLSEAQLHRYARQMILPEVDEEGQAKLLASRVLVVGAGGLGAPLLLYLAAAGVGTLGVVDDDRVDVTNLQRQILFDTDDVGRLKAECAREALCALNPDIRVETHATRLTRANADALIRQYDLIADGTDSAETRFLVADTCYWAQRPLISAAVLGFDGQIATLRAPLETGSACYRCIMGAPPPPLVRPSCAESGVLGAVAGMVGALQALEVIKLALGLGPDLDGRVLLLDTLSYTVRVVRATRDPGCAFCAAPASRINR